MKFFFLIAFFFLTAKLCGQLQDKNLRVNQYLQKSLRQKKTANILALSGGALFVSGLIVTGTDDNKFLISSQQLAGLGISALGVLAAVSSIPFYISANRNESKSLKITPTAASFSTTENRYISAGLTVEF